MSKLTVKQKKFCKEFMKNNGNATQAVIDAGYDVIKKGQVNRNLARSIGSENLAKPAIRQCLNKSFDWNDDLKIAVTKTHAHLLTQDVNLKVKAKALDMYYRMKGMYK